MEFIILGSGSSLGSPWINNYWGNCDKKMAIIGGEMFRFSLKSLSVLIDLHLI